jgi:hypothetical protein
LLSKNKFEDSLRVRLMNQKDNVKLER